MSQTTIEAQPLIAIEKAHSGAMIALRVPMDVAARIAVPEGERPEDLHVTLCYLGKAQDIPEHVLRRISAECQAFAARERPLFARLSGVGRFGGSNGSDGLDVLYASVDGPELAAFRERILAAVIYGAEYMPPMDHGFTPHVTLKYMGPEEKAPVDHLPHMEMVFDSIECHYGGTFESFKLRGAPLQPYEMAKAKLLASAAAEWEAGWQKIIPLSGKPLSFAVHKKLDAEGGVESLHYRFASPRIKATWGFSLPIPYPARRGGRALCHPKGIQPLAKLAEPGERYSLAASGTYRLGLASDGMVEVLMDTTVERFSGRHIFRKETRTDSIHKGWWFVERPDDGAPMALAKDRSALALELSKAGSRIAIMPKDALDFSRGYAVYRLPKYSPRSCHLRSVIKQAEEQRYTLGVAYPASELDAHGDFATADEIERAAWDFLENRKVGLMHRFGTEGRGRVVESYIYRFAATEFAGQKIEPGDWLMGVVWDEPAWELVKSGQITGFSIQGWATRED